jgi:hypothetical protein
MSTLPVCSNSRVVRHLLRHIGERLVERPIDGPKIPAPTPDRAAPRLFYPNAAKTSSSAFN